MLNATDLRVDFEVGSAYVKYRQLPAGSRPTSTRLTEDVVVNFNAAGEVVGIEVIELRAEAVEAAAAFAMQNGLDFPRLRDFLRDAVIEDGEIHVESIGGTIHNTISTERV